MKTLIFWSMFTPYVADKKKTFGKMTPSVLLGLGSSRIVGHGVLNGPVSITACH